jgi:hypothetical protein
MDHESPNETHNRQVGAFKKNILTEANDLGDLRGDECHVSMNDKELAAVYQISEGHVRRIHCVARKRKEHPSQPIGRPHKLTDDQKREVIEIILTTANDLNFPTKREVLDEIENRTTQY